MSDYTTVKKLIAKLKKMPANAIVVWRDHDQSADEFNGYVDFVREAEPELVEEISSRLDREVEVVVLSG